MRLRGIAPLLLLALSLPAAAAPTLAPLSTHPVEGRSSILTLSKDGAPATGVAVTAIYRENAHSSLRREQAIGVTDHDGRLSWTPDAAGVVVLSWDGGSHAVSVLHDGVPLGGVLVAVLAGLALLGGSVLFFLQMLRQPSSELIEGVERFGEPPST